MRPLLWGASAFVMSFIFQTRQPMFTKRIHHLTAGRRLAFASNVVAYGLLLLLFISALFCVWSCNGQDDKYYITIQNNSEKEIIYQSSLYSSMADTTCFKPMTKREYRQLIDLCMIEPHSCRKVGIDIVVNCLQSYPNTAWSLGIFNREDIDNMSCEEFKKAYPLKKEWQLTFEDLQACDWTLVYTPEE